MFKLKALVISVGVVGGCGVLGLCIGAAWDKLDPPADGEVVREARRAHSTAESPSLAEPTDAEPTGTANRQLAENDSDRLIGGREINWYESPESLNLDGTMEVHCPAESDGGYGAVWGVGPFTGDSSICAAAVFQGLIAMESGGSVRVRAVPAPRHFDGATAHGVETSEFDDYPTAFRLAAP